MYSPFQLAKKYLNYYRNSSNSKGHGVHSPFVFEFIKFIKNDRKPYPDYHDIEGLRKMLLADNRSIEVEDFGAGSASLKTSQRQVSRIAASSLKPKKFAQLLYRMARFYQPESIIELGTSLGITTSYLARSCPHAKVITMEGSHEIATIAAENFRKLGLKNIEIVQGDFAKTLDPVLTGIEEIDFVFIDGNHREEATIEYFRKFLQHSHENTIMVFDDIHWSQGMENAWKQISEHDDVTLSIDLFFIGIVFFRKEFKVKQQFSIRF